MNTGMPSTSQKIQRLLDFHSKRVEALTLTLELLEGTAREKKLNGHGTILAQALRQEQGKKRIGRPPIQRHAAEAAAAQETIPPKESATERKKRLDRERHRQATIDKHKPTRSEKTTANVGEQRAQSALTLAWFADHPGTTAKEYRTESGHPLGAWRGIGSMVRYKYLKTDPNGKITRTAKVFNP